MSISSSPVQQTAGKTSAGGSATKTISISTPASGGHLVLLINRPHTISISGVTGGGVTWASGGSVSETSSQQAYEIWYGSGSSGSGSTISVTISNTYAVIEYNFSEWSGVDTTPVLDPSVSSNTGTSSTITSSSVTPTAGKEVLLLSIGGLNGGGAATDSPTGSFTALTRSGTFTYGAYAYRVVASASGSYQTTWAASVGYRPWATLIVGFDAAAGGGGGVFNPYFYRMVADCGSLF